MYTTEFFTDANASLLGDMSPETYHTLARKYTTTVELDTVDVKSDNFKEQLKAALDKANMVLVSGVMHTTSDGVMEMKEEFEKLVNCIKEVVTEGKHYIHILGPHKTPYPHPSLLKMLEDRKYTLEEGGLWAPGQAMPEQTIIAEMKEGGMELTTFLMCSILSNFNTVKTKEVTARTIGCDPSKVPAEMMDVVLLSAEHAIQLAKPVAAVAFPDKFMDTAADDTSVAKAIATAGKIKSAGDEPQDEEKESLKRKLLSDKALTIKTHCEEVYHLLCKAGAFDVQKKLGQLPTLTSKWFDVVKGTPIECFRNFDAEDLKKLGANSLMQAFVIMLRIHAGDEALLERLLFDISTHNVPVESAMHDPVKNPDKAALSKYLFSGRFPDRVWGKVCGCPRYTVMPDRLVHSDGKPQVGHLGNGAELVRQAIRGDKAVLDFFGLDAPLVKENMGAGAARVLEKCWVVVATCA